MMEAAFDTSRAVKRLETGGFIENPSEAVGDVVSASRAGPATKTDLEPLATETGLSSRTAGIRRDLRNRTLAIIGANIALIGIGIAIARWLFGNPE